MLCFKNDKEISWLVLRTVCHDIYFSDGSKSDCPNKETTKVSHLWYQWVPFYFLLAAAAFVMPHVVHRNFGMGDIEPLVRSVNNQQKNQLKNLNSN